MLQELMMFIEKGDSMTARRYDSDNLEQKEGFFAEDRYVTWQSMFFMSKEEQTKKLGEYKAIFDAIGSSMNDTSSFFAKKQAAMDKQRKEVERLAPQWKLPPKGTSHYGIALAKKTVKKGFKGAKVISAAGSAGQWSITKNALGVPQYRSRFGWILFKAKGEPFCQLRTFFISEDYKGGGRYQKDRDITFSKLRWQKCR